MDEAQLRRSMAHLKAWWVHQLSMASQRFQAAKANSTGRQVYAAQVNALGECIKSLDIALSEVGIVITDDEVQEILAVKFGKKGNGNSGTD